MYPNKATESPQYLIYSLWLIVALLSLLTTLPLPYVGEESVYTLTSLEMAFNHEWFVPTLYGANYARPPLFNWLIIPVAHLLGWTHVLVASRLVTFGATVCTSLVLMWFTQKCFKNKTLTLFCALLYVSGDVLFRRGWLAYADPLFSFFIFGAIACLWIAIEEERSSFLCLAMIGLIASFLTKALTGYIFYGISAFVLFCRYYHSEPSKRWFLIKPYSLILHGIAIVFPVVWNIYVTEGAHGGAMIRDVLVKLNFAQLTNYIFKVLWFPFDVFSRWLPVSVLVVYFWVKHIKAKKPENVLKGRHAKTAVWILGLNILPYWLAPETHARYIMPLYPFFALVLGCLIWQLGKPAVRTTFLWLVVCIVLRYVAGIWGFPYYEAHYRGNYKFVAEDILSIVQDKPLYVNDVTAAGSSVAAEIDAKLFPGRTLKYPDKAFKQGFLISHMPDFPDTDIVKTYKLGNQTVYLLKLEVLVVNSH
jgi:4-amino-4-deoxy-L-arabinose transferase-like glycosyltransferase